tara:strand:+ start:3519 stop:5657 length:2139 start_codon:yes stop_codon:yes gene_type:complete
MGFVQSASTQYIETNLTNYGRGLLLSGTTSGLAGLVNFVKSFGLSDIDIDYRQTSLTGHTAQLGFIPDVTGDLCDCCNGLNDGFVQSSYLCWNGCTSHPPGDRQLLVGIRKNQTSPMGYYDTAEVDIYLHDYFALLKLVSNLYAYDQTLFWEGYSLPSATQSIFEDEVRDKLGLGAGASIATIGSTLRSLGYSQNQGGYGRGVFLDFWDDVIIYDPTSGAQSKENVEVRFDSPLDKNNHQVLAGGSYLYAQGAGSTWATTGIQDNLTPDIDFSNGAYMNMSQLTPNVYPNNGAGNKGAISPWTVSFSSVPDFKGAGPAGIGFPITDIGYIALPTYTSEGQPGGGGGHAQEFDPYSEYPYWPSDDSGFISLFTNWNNEDIYFMGYCNPEQLENHFNDGTAYNTSGNWTLNSGANIPYSIFGDLNTQIYDYVRYYTPALRQHLEVPIVGAGYTQQSGSVGYYIPRAKKIIDGWQNQTVPTLSQGNQVVQTPARGDSSLSTLGYFGTTLEYMKSPGTAGSGPLGGMSTVPSTTTNIYGNETATSIYGGGAYFNWFTRKMIQSDYILDAIGANGSSPFPTTASVFSARSSSNLINVGFAGGASDDVDEFNISIPVTYKVYSSDDPTVQPAQIKVNFIYNKVAALQSIGYSGKSATYGSSTVPYYRLFDKTEIKFYGEDGDSTNISSISPAISAFQENNATGNKIFRKIHSSSNQVI